MRFEQSMNPKPKSHPGLVPPTPKGLLPGVVIGALATEATHAAGFTFTPLVYWIFAFATAIIAQCASVPDKRFAYSRQDAAVQKDNMRIWRGVAGGLFLTGMVNFLVLHPQWQITRDATSVVKTIDAGFDAAKKMVTWHSATPTTPNTLVNWGRHNFADPHV